MADWLAADSAGRRGAARPPRRPASGEGLTTWLARTARRGRPYLASRVCEAFAARRRGGAPERSRAGGGEPGGQRAAEEVGPRPFGRSVRGPTAARAASGCGHRHSSPATLTHAVTGLPRARPRVFPPLPPDGGAHARHRQPDVQSRPSERPPTAPSLLIEATSSLTPPPPGQMGSPTSGDRRAGRVGHMTSGGVVLAALGPCR